MQPIIGMFVAIDQDRTAHALHNYAHAIEQCGALPLIIPYLQNEESFARLTALCDGFCFTGGVDVDPVHYGEEKSPFCGEIQEHRDALELRAFDLILPTGKPILGICRGAQVINVALGGTLFQDLSSELPSDIAHRQTEEKYAPSHGVCVLPGTPLHALVGAARMSANSFHHQAAKRLGRDLLPMAYADDGVIEGFYHGTHPYLRAYQWHPERLFDTNAQNHAIFADFIKHCKDVLKNQK